jgi:non-ribosomal peptide synthetase component F
VFGAVVSGRPADLPGVEEMIGLFINTIPIRVKYEPADTPVRLLKLLQEHSIGSTPHHYMNLSEIQSQSEIGLALIDHIMVFENYAVKILENEGVLNTNTESEERLSVESVEVFERTNYNFNILIVPSSVSLKIGFTYNGSCYDQDAIKKLVTHFDTLIREFAYNPEQSLQAISYLSTEEEQDMLFSHYDIEVAYPRDKTVVDLFEEQVKKAPDKTALVYEANEISYQELNNRSNQLAHYLKDNFKIKTDDLIGFQLARSENMIIAILAILKTGAAYIPIDIDSPEEKIKYIEEDSGCLLIIDNAKLDAFIAESLVCQKTNLEKELRPDNLIYAIYTSGSTGLPKAF